MTLREPPKVPRTANLIGRIVGLVLLVSAFALVIWTAATNQQATAIERSNPLVHAPGEHISAGGTLFHVRTFGGGSSTTLLIHDDTVSGGTQLAPLANDLAEAGRRVIVPDLAGYGFSSRPVEPGRALSTTGLTESLAELLEEMGASPVEVVGFGWGGEVAAELAVTRPDLVAGLTFVDTPSLPVPTDGWNSLMALPLGVGEAVAYTREGAGEAAAERFRTECPSWAECDDPEVREEYRRATEVPGTARAIWARQASGRATVAAARLAEIDIPATVVVVDGTREDAESLADRLPDARVVETSAGELVEVIVG